MGTVPNDIQDLIEDLRPKLTGIPEIDIHDGRVSWKVGCAAGYLAANVLPDVQAALKNPGQGPQTPRHEVVNMPKSQNPPGSVLVTQQRAFARAAVADATRIWLRPLTRRELREYGFIDTDQPKSLQKSQTGQE
jgi:hypothetical protein